MVRGGLGVTILPATAREMLAEPGLVARPIDDPAFVRATALVKKRGRTLPGVTDAFIKLMLERLGRRLDDGWIDDQDDNGHALAPPACCAARNSLPQKALCNLREAKVPAGEIVLLKAPSCSKKHAS